MQIKGNSFIVTGGASGLGEATAKHLIERGANVAIFDLNEERAAEVAKELGQKAFAPSGSIDVTSEDAVKKAIEQTVAKFGKLAGVVNCGGVATAARTARAGGKTSGTMSLDMFDFTLKVNTLGTFNVSKQVAQAIAKQEPFDEDGERGVIINTASVAYQDGQTGQVAYSASKGAVASMTLPMARDLAPIGIRVMTIAPGIFETNMTAVMNEAAKAKIIKDAIFPNRMGKAPEYALLAGHIIENGMLNGEVIRIDGASRLGKL
ncbi:hypothetical protein INT43_007921 [Umbelopsis isabellina]|uniref:3-hydroxyacyl-CoA dehydrogenase n=1 Tax=Mortierella isabellina TaxID=91625 RepID=A0A8H7UFB9_MORIS|nr:hypothetical protein INT43_007921 [Umbelopsis isabellina]